jgi:hypothetical protein
MNAEALLLRQIHPSFLNDGEPSSAALRPTPKDQDRLSFEDGDRIAPEASWRRDTAGALHSAGVLGVQARACRDEDLTIDPDGEPHPEHVSVDFTGKSSGQRKQIAKRLRDHAMRRGWLYGPID